jgi:hypothetical protein
MAKTMVKFSSRHPELEFSRYVIPQVPGSAARSTAVHGVVESFFKSKKYIVPSAVVSPVFAGCVAAVYVGTSAAHFDPARQAQVYNADRALEPPVGAEDRRSFQIELNHLVSAQLSEANGSYGEKKLARMMSNASPAFDSDGRPILRMLIADNVVNVGVAQGNIFFTQSSGRFAAQILEARLREELRRGNPPKVSESDVEHDMMLLQKALSPAESELALRSPHSLQAGTQSRWTPAANRQ